MSLFDGDEQRCSEYCAAARRQLEDMLDQRTAELIALRKAAVEHSIASPSKFATMQSALGPWGQRYEPLPLCFFLCF